ncbi:MAG: DUF2153 family protein [Candidatus Bathyarchaeia archaeon]
MSEDWATMKKRQIEKVRGLQPKDRLDMVEAIALMNQYISSSCQGWAQWIYNPMVINRFNEKELKDFYDRFRKITLEFLEFDVEATERLKPPLEKGRKEQPPRYA